MNHIIQCSQTDLYTNAAFIIEGIEKVAKVTKEKVIPIKVFESYTRKVNSGLMSVFLDFFEEKPVGVYVLELKGDGYNSCFVEVELVYNLPVATPKEALDLVGIPWAKEMGANRLVAYNPMIDPDREPIADRRLRKYGFNKIAALYERMI